MKFISSLTLIAASVLVSCVPKAPQNIEKDAGAALNIVSTHSKSKGMVAAANPYAVQAGLEVLRAGGSAVDAALAVQAVLGLVEPQSSGLGGGAFMLVYDPKKAEVWAYDGRETAPAAATADLFIDPETGEPLRFFEGIASGRSTGVPGAVVMLDMAHKNYGKRPWRENLSGAIELAEKGFTVSPRLSGIIKRVGARLVLKRDDNARGYFFLEDGSELPVGSVRDNPEYAQTLRAVADNPRAILEGPIAQAILDAVRLEPLPGTMTLEDMASYQPRKTRALCSSYREHVVCGPQPPSSGGVAVQSILGMMENFDMSAIGPSALGWHIFAEASFLAYADRNKYVADPEFVKVETGDMLDKDYLRARSKLINMDSAKGEYKAGNPSAFARGKDATPESPGTSHFTIVDGEGLVVSMTTTVESIFGNQRMAAGFMLNNQLTDFSFKAVDGAGVPIANAPAGGKRPRSSMAPHIVFNPKGEFLFATGSPGGSSIIAYTAKTIIGMIDWGLTPQEAIELPNVIARRGTVKLETQGLEPELTDEPERMGPAARFGLPEATASALEAKGHKLRRSKGEISGLHIIYRDKDGRLIGGADPRREGVATGL